MITNTLEKKKSVKVALSFFVVVVVVVKRGQPVKEIKREIRINIHQ